MYKLTPESIRAEHLIFEALADPRLVLRRQVHSKVEFLPPVRKGALVSKVAAPFYFIVLAQLGLVSVLRPASTRKGDLRAEPAVHSPVLLVC